jgi:dihydrofolate synthase/folylpolyglutamate synthase
MMGHKDARGFLSHFAGLASRAIAVAVAATHEPARQAGELAAIARRAGLAADTAGSVAEALERLAREHPGAKRVVICGSLYLAGQVLAQQEGVAVEPN